jgi:hypothetical protein
MGENGLGKWDFLRKRVCCASVVGVRKCPFLSAPLQGTKRQTTWLFTPKKVADIYFCAFL